MFQLRMFNIMELAVWIGLFLALVLNIMDLDKVIGVKANGSLEFQSHN